MTPRVDVAPFTLASSLHGELTPAYPDSGPRRSPEHSRPARRRRALSVKLGSVDDLIAAAWEHPEREAGTPASAGAAT